MSSYSEWELLVVAEDIEPGDTVNVENEDGEVSQLVFKKYLSGMIHLMDAERNVIKFRGDNLEEKSGSKIIVGKSEEELSI